MIALKQNIQGPEYQKQTKLYSSSKSSPVCSYCIVIRRNKSKYNFGWVVLGFGVWFLLAQHSYQQNEVTFSPKNSYHWEQLLYRYHLCISTETNANRRIIQINCSSKISALNHAHLVHFYLVMKCRAIACMLVPQVRHTKPSHQKQMGSHCAKTSQDWICPLGTMLLSQCFSLELLASC